MALLCVWALQGYSAVGHCWHTLRLGTARILTYFVKGRYREIQRVSVVGVLQGYSAVRCGMRGGWALLGYSKMEHCKDFFCAAGIFCNWALRDTLRCVCSDTLQFGTAENLSRSLALAQQGYFQGRALLGYSAVGHCWDTLRLGSPGIIGGFAAVRPFTEGEENIHLSKIYHLHFENGEQ